MTSTGEHVHLLVHAEGHRDRLERMLVKTLKGKGKVDVRRAKQTIVRLRHGRVTDASTYVLKPVNQKVSRFRPYTPHRNSGPIYGARVGCTRNLNRRKSPFGRGKLATETPKQTPASLNTGDAAIRMAA